SPRASARAAPRPPAPRAPPRANLLEPPRRQPPRLEERRILLPPFRPGGADDCGVNAGHAQREAQRRTGGRLGRDFQERIVERLEPRPVGLVVRLGWVPLPIPGGLGEGALGDHAYLPGDRHRQRALDGFLIGDAHRGLQRVEAPALDRVARRRTIAAVADVAREAALARLLQGLDDLALAERLERAAVELDEIDVAGRQALEASLDAGQQRTPPPVRARPAAGVAALAEQIELAAPRADRLADQDLAVVVALGRVDHVEPGVERTAEEPADGPAAHALVADLGATEAQHARHHVSPAEPALLQS